MRSFLCILIMLQLQIMKKIIHFLILLIISATDPTNIYAEVYYCSGMWRDKPCDSPTTTHLKSSSTYPGSKELSNKRSLLHELSMKAFKTSREYKIRYDISAIENFCLEKSTSLIECQREVNDMNDRIDDRIASLELIKEQKRANDLQRERNEIESKKPPTQINILEHNTLIVKPKRRSPYNKHEYSYKSESSTIRRNLGSSTSTIKRGELYKEPSSQKTPAANISNTTPKNTKSRLGIFK